MRERLCQGSVRVDYDGACLLYVLLDGLNVPRDREGLVLEGADDTDAGVVELVYGHPVSGEGNVLECDARHDFYARVESDDTFQRDGMGPAMAKFIAIVSHQGLIDDAYLGQPDPDPGMFGLPTEDDGSRDDVLLGQNLRTCTGYHADVEALKKASTRIVVAVGEESEGELAHRGGEGIAGRLGLEPVTFPSNHGGFLGGEFGQEGAPEPFAAKLREVLATP